MPGGAFTFGGLQYHLQKQKEFLCRARLLIALMKHTGNTLAPGSILFPIETGVTVAPSCQGGLSRPLLLSPGSSEGSDSHGDLSLERGENAFAHCCWEWQWAVLSTLIHQPTPWLQVAPTGSWHHCWEWATPALLSSQGRLNNGFDG